MASTVLPNGIIIPEKYSRDWYSDLYHNWQELDNLLGGGTPKDGTLTIQKNGATVGTFSANQATDETVNITVPTKTSDLTNDSNFVQSSDLATVATSGSYNDLSNKPTIPTVNNATLTIQRNGTTVDTFTANASSNVTANITVPTKTSDLTNDSGFITSDNTKIPLAGSNAISGDLIPSTDGTVNLGGPSYQWNNAYIKSLTINGVACGDILTHNASEFVNLTNDQTINGSKYFTSLLSKSNTLARGSLPTTNINEDPIFVAADKNNRRTLAFFNYYYPSGDGKVVLYVYNQNTTNFDNIGLGFSFANQTNIKSVYPSITETYNLGTTTNKWKSFNGINPGALSLPSSTYINVDTTNWDVAGGTNVYTPPANGWLHIRVVGATELMVRWTGWRFGDRRVSATATDLGVTIPVVAGVTVDVVTVASGFDGKCQFFPSQGNV